MQYTALIEIVKDTTYGTYETNVFRRIVVH